VGGGLIKFLNHPVLDAIGWIFILLGGIFLTWGVQRYRQAGIRIFEFRGGLLHTKSVVVDRQVALFGSVNMDVRSFWLDFEITLGVYDPDFAQRLLALQDKYIEDSMPVDLQTWQQRPGKERFIENLARLTSPLL
jgi:cardiolipin synthase